MKSRKQGRSSIARPNVHDKLIISRTINNEKTSLLRRLTFVTTQAIAANTWAGFATTGTFCRSNCPEFATLENVYANWRMLAIRVHVECAGTNGTILFGDDRSGSTSAPASQQAVWRQTNAKVFASDATMLRLASHTSEAVAPEDFLFVPTTTNYNSYAMSWGVAALNAGTIYTYYEFVVEFKGPD